MNKAFEKILEKLEELRQKQIKELCEHKDFTSEMQSMRGHNILQDAKKIVQEVAEEYNNSWIPCSERLPEEYTVLCCDKYGEIMVGHPYFDEVSDTNYSAESDNEMMYNCVAWQPLPEPFKERD